MDSMTGFGRGTLARDGRTVVVEMKSVNNRFLDINMRMPRSFSLLEETVRDEVKKVLHRGRVEVAVTYENVRPDAFGIQVDTALAAAYMQGLQTLKEATGLTDEPTLAQISRLDGVLKVTEAQEDMDTLECMLREAVRLALEQLTAFRHTEGLKLKEDISSRAAALRRGMEVIGESVPQLMADYEARLTQRVTELVSDAGVDTVRIAQEVAIMADRVAIDEELTRLDSHLRQLDADMALDEPVGRKLDFLVQELNREVNTICSKSQAVAVTSVGLAMKNEIEKIREQVQNVE